VFIRWLKLTDTPEIVSIAKEMDIEVDTYHIKLILTHFPHLCFGIYKENMLAGVILTVEYEKSIQIKYFMVKNNFQKKNLGKRLLKTLMEIATMYNKNVYLIFPEKYQLFFENFGFKKTIDIKKWINRGNIPPFYFSNKEAKELESYDFENKVQILDYETFNEERTFFLFDEMQRNSSLKFALPNSFQHSCSITSKDVFLGPWISKDEYEAEKMIKGVLFFRGLKRVISYSPDIKNINKLFKKYNFEKTEKLVFLSYGDCEINFNNIYSFSF
jgi:GNAT superfamily N-acetyltransferase